MQIEEPRDNEEAGKNKTNPGGKDFGRGINHDRGALKQCQDGLAATGKRTVFWLKKTANEEVCRYNQDNPFPGAEEKKQKTCGCKGSIEPGDVFVDLLKRDGTHCIHTWPRVRCKGTALEYVEQGQQEIRRALIVCCACAKYAADAGFVAGTGKFIIRTGCKVKGRAVSYDMSYVA